MKASRTILLLLLVAGLGGYIWFHERHRMSPEERRELMRQAFDLPVERIHRIGLRTPTMDVTLFHTPAGWQLEHPKGARASDAMVRQTLARLRSLNRGELITVADMKERGQTLADFGLAVPGLVLRLETPQVSREYRIGDPNPLGNALYVKEESTQNIMLVSSDLMDILPKDANAFRDRDLIPLNPADLTSLTLVGPGRVLRLTRNKERWMIVEPVSAAADPEQMDILLQKLDTVRIDGMVNDPETNVDYGFGDAPDVIRMQTAGSEVPYELAIGGNVPGNPDACYARISGQGGLVVVSKGMRQIARIETAALRDRRLLDLEFEQLAAVEVVHPDRRLRVERDGGDWRVTAPVAHAASAARIQQMLQTWREARVESFPVLETPPEAQYRVRFMSAGTPAAPAAAFEVLNGDPGPGRVWIRREGTREVLQVVPDLVRYSPVEVLPYLSRRMLRFEPSDVVRVSVQRGGETREAIRSSPEVDWRAAEESATLQPGALRDLLARLSDLRAESLLELNPPSLEPYGLETPDLRISIGLGGERPANRTLLVSRPDDQAPAVAMVQGEEVVFHLSTEQWEAFQTPIATKPEPAPPGPPDAEESPRP